MDINTLERANEIQDILADLYAKKKELVKVLGRLNLEEEDATKKIKKVKRIKNGGFTSTDDEEDGIPDYLTKDKCLISVYNEKGGSVRVEITSKFIEDSLSLELDIVKSSINELETEFKNL